MRGRFPNPEQLDGILKTLDTDNSGGLSKDELLDGDMKSPNGFANNQESKDLRDKENPCKFTTYEVFASAMKLSRD